MTPHLGTRETVSDAGAFSTVAVAVAVGRVGVADGKATVGGIGVGVVVWPSRTAATTCVGGAGGRRTCNASVTARSSAKRTVATTPSASNKFVRQEAECGH